MMSSDLPFRDGLWVVDFEYQATKGDEPYVLCVVALELRSGRQIKLWRDELGPLPPFPTDEHALFIAYSATAEASCCLSLGWPTPTHVLDLLVEFRLHTNGRWEPAYDDKGKRIAENLLAALAHFGLPSMGSTFKNAMRDLILNHEGNWSETEKQHVLEYCSADVEATAKLFFAMQPHLDRDLRRSLLRGAFMPAASRIERHGIPIDVETLRRLATNWDALRLKIVQAKDKNRIYDGLVWKMDRWAAKIASEGKAWPLTKSGHLALDKKTFKDRAMVYPDVEEYRQLRKTISELRLADLVIGKDGRNRAYLFPFRTKTGRNAPSPSEQIFGGPKWLRSLIKPSEGRGVALIDWRAQEIGIVAALSGDKAMMEAYRSGDIYLALAKATGAVPQDATKAHPMRDVFKTVMLGTNYGMGAETLAERIGKPASVARDLLRQYKESYPVFARWGDAVENFAIWRGNLWTALGWRQYFDDDADKRLNVRAARNFLAQGNGAEMMRIAALLGLERGVTICTPIHDLHTDP